MSLLRGLELLGNNTFYDVEVTPPATKVTPPYERPYTPPYTPIAEPVYIEPYRDTGITPVYRENLPPLVPLSRTRMIIPPSPGPRYVQGPLTAEQNIPATHSPYPPPMLIPDKAIVKILVSKNIYSALQKRGLETVAARRRLLDYNTQREVETEALNRTLQDIELIQQGKMQAIQADPKWQYEAIKYKLVDAAELRNLMSHIVPIQSWLVKERGSKGG